MAAPALNDDRPENAVATDERIRADLARLLQERLVRESMLGVWVHPILIAVVVALAWPDAPSQLLLAWGGAVLLTALLRDRKSTRLNSSHVAISYAVFCLKKKKRRKPGNA